MCLSTRVCSSKWPPSPFRIVTSAFIHRRAFRYSIEVQSFICEIKYTCTCMWLIVLAMDRVKEEITIFLVWRKKGSKTKKRMKGEEIDKGDYGPPTRKVYFFRLLPDLNQAVSLFSSRMRVKRVSRIHHRTSLFQCQKLLEINRKRNCM